MTTLPIPGFVDLQVNGYKGTDFGGSELTEASCAKACSQLLNHGTAAFLPTLITNPPEVFERNLPIVARVMKSPEFKGKLPGFHIEGPFISSQPGAIGAHNPKYARNPDIKLLNQMQKWADGQIKLMTIASELPGTPEFIKEARKLGIVITLGHSLATADDIKRAYEAGATGLTHLGNGIPNQLPRHPNPIWSGLAQDGLHAMIITDGHHIPDSFIKVAIKTKGLAYTIVVSDAVSIAGLPPGTYGTLGQEVVLHPNGKLENPKVGCLAGSASTMIECMNYLAKLKLLNLEDMIKVSYYNPLALIGVSPAEITATTKLAYDSERYTFSY